MKVIPAKDGCTEPGRSGVAEAEEATLGKRLSARMHIHAYMSAVITPARMLSAAADATRVRLLVALESAPRNGLCVCELVDALREPQYNISRHLRILAAAGLVSERAEGRWVYYRTADDRPEVRALLAFLRAASSSMTDDDRSRVRKRLALRQSGSCVVGVQDPTLLGRR